MVPNGDLTPSPRLTLPSQPANTTDIDCLCHKCGVVARDEIPPGTLSLLILRVLARSVELHGYEIADTIERISNDVLQVEEGSLYPALQRMLLKGWVTAKWGVTAGNRRARYYRMTAAGRKQLAVEMSQFERVVGAISRVIDAV